MRVTKLFAGLGGELHYIDGLCYCKYEKHAIEWVCYRCQNVGSVPVPIQEVLNGGDHSY